MNLQKLEYMIETKQKQIEDLAKDIAELDKDRRILFYKQHKYDVGDRVELVSNQDTPEKHKSSPGWSYALHFMHPGNIATVVEVNCYKQRVTYAIKFDNQTCYYSNSKDTYEDDHVWSFKEDELKFAESKNYVVTIHYDLDGSCVRNVTCNEADLKKCLTELVKVGIIASYDIQERKADEY